MAPGQQPLGLADLLQRAVTLHRQGRLDDAVRLYRQILNVRSDHFEARHLLGVLRAQQGRNGEALGLIEAALKHKPGDADAHFNRGNILVALGRNDEALASYDRALIARPDFAGALRNRANTLILLDRCEEALTAYAAVTAVTPGQPGDLSNQGAVLLRLDRFAEALQSYDQSLALRSDDADALIGRGHALFGLKRYEDAARCYDLALGFRPGDAGVLSNRGAALLEVGQCDEAFACFDACLAIAPERADARFAACMARLRVLYSDAAEIDNSRAAYEEKLLALCDYAAAGNAKGLAEGVGSSQPFYLAYQGLNDRELQARYGALVCRLMAEKYPLPPLPAPPAPGQPVRVGIISGFFRQHSNWKIPIKGWLSQLDRSRFRLFGYYTASERDAETEVAASLCERFVQGPRAVGDWRAAILEYAPHVLIYPEVGMNPAAARLAAQRLAPVQCTSWGHPDTSGFPTLDYYLSSAQMETPEADAHYTETLVRLPGLSIYYEPADATPTPVDRAALGLRPGACVFWCGQSLYKYLPQFDHVFPRIAQQAGDCQFVFIEFLKGRHVTELFRKRLDSAFVSAGLQFRDHCIFLPRLDQQAFIATAGACDGFLDSIGWSGCNSTMESLPYDLPAVTLPGVLMRSRHTAAILTMMDCTETIAGTVDDYIAVAVRLARDPVWRAAISSRIASNKSRLYRDRAPIAALEEFLERSARAAIA